MSETRQKLFEKHHPNFSDEEIKTALEERRFVFSFNARVIFSVPPESSFLGLKLVLANGKTEIVAMDYVAAETLRLALEKLHSEGWTPNPITATPH